MIIPLEGTGWDLEASALIKGGKNKEAAQKFLDFCTSEEVARVAGENAYIPARKDFQTGDTQKARAAFLPSNPLESALMRGRVLEKWRGLFDAR